MSRNKEVLEAFENFRQKHSKQNREIIVNQQLQQDLAKLWDENTSLRLQLSQSNHQLKVRQNRVIDQVITNLQSLKSDYEPSTFTHTSQPVERRVVAVPPSLASIQEATRTPKDENTRKDTTERPSSSRSSLSDEEPSVEAVKSRRRSTRRRQSRIELPDPRLLERSSAEPSVAASGNEDDENDGDTHKASIKAGKKRRNIEDQEDTPKMRRRSSQDSPQTSTSRRNGVRKMMKSKQNFIEEPPKKRVQKLVQSPENIEDIEIKETDMSRSVSVDAEGRPSRRARKSVNYALPSLRAKMRKPDPLDTVPVEISSGNAESLASVLADDTTVIRMAQATKRIGAEYSQISKEPIEGVSPIELVNDNLFEWKGYLKGPQGTPYESGKFHFTLTYPENFPFKAPTVQFKTKIYHPNFDQDGNICIGLLKAESWKPTARVSQIFQSLLQLLAEPNPDDPLDADAAETYRTNRSKFNDSAKDYVERYAKA
ncbi:hypothetical protein E3Q06_00143 [Wallemia mellicola]|nr:hypothetical protein E3Q21_00143 [Wallemia mellicola]TIB92673.1 hypothetical protein E3Q20_00143 [Wallemia mellicola]TIC22624.1 hypothetical protein E3Q12_02575 [Wallemia mellicola]TIC38203.1 hypothetical protein E3Q09_00302 [Wallemia mellicola]TIC44565.1 hypothetical protein E3Q07_00143 [Wallemia mellicola]